MLSSPTAKKDSEVTHIHPLIESIDGPEQMATERLRDYCAGHIHYLFTTLIADILQFGASPAQHSQASSDLSDLLLLISNVDASTLDTWTALSKQACSNKKLSVCNLYSKNKAVLEGRTYSKACIVTFPLFSELMKEERKVGTVSVRKKDRETLIGLMKYIIPGIAVEHTYSRGPVGDFGPTMTSILASAVEVLQNCQEIADKFKDFVPSYEIDYPLDFSFMDALKDGSLVKSIRAWVTMKDEEEQPVAAAATIPVAAPAAIARPQVVNQRQQLTNDFAAAQAQRELEREQKYTPNIAPATAPAAIAVTEPGKIIYQPQKQHAAQQQQMPANVVTDANGQMYAVGPNGQLMALAPQGMQMPGHFNQMPQMDPRAAARMRQDQLRNGMPAHGGLLQQAQPPGVVIGPDGQQYVVMNGQYVPLAALQQQMPVPVMQAPQMQQTWPGAVQPVQQPMQQGWPGATPTAFAQPPVRQAWPGSTVTNQAPIQPVRRW